MEKVNLKGVAKYCYKAMGKAIADYHMLSEGDRILVAVSGGKDSLSLLKLFQMRKTRIPIDFEIVACFVDTNFIHVDRDVLVDYFKSCGIECVVKDLMLDEDNINCFWCSWNRRKLLFETAREFNCNKLALGHNMDDIVETILMNFFFRGEIGTSPPALDLFEGEIKVIRPLCYIQKKEVLNFASEFPFPDTHYECDYGKDSSREYVKKMIHDLEKECPFVKKNIFRALRRVKQGYLL
ncbi:MAG: tRNA 2-thiocytidine(32) synthetase TtcA [Candidatus Omnitrophota bacterium]|nr:MAG: tRNA 2-thiocytidine(32) synthetase TtcA [Candidatus Omnitrophota bacterium]